MGDIAQRAGVSRTAVSYALNGLPGVAGATRERVLRIAAELGFEANFAAKAMHGGITRTVAIALQPPERSLSIEAFRRQLISGIEMALQEHEYGLLIQFAPSLEAEIKSYERWWLQRSVDGFLVLNLQTDDPRVRAIEAIGAPAVLIGGPVAGTVLPSVWADDAAAITEAVEYLAGLGHHRIARVAGPAELLHVSTRTVAFSAACERLGIASSCKTVPGGYTREEGQQATRKLLGTRPRPTAIMYDNDVSALSGLAVAREMRVHVPGELSLIGWEDSMLCEVVHPMLTVLHRDVVAYGQRAAELLLDVVKGENTGSVQGETPWLKARASTGPAPM
jgi:DNA-binding LacI/PurR family transcriptional regulator